MGKFCRIGTKVEVRDERSRERGRQVDRPEGTGVIRDLYGRHGRDTKPKDRTPPYFVEFPDGASGWYEADEVRRTNGKGC